MPRTKITKKRKRRKSNLLGEKKMLKRSKTAQGGKLHKSLQDESYQNAATRRSTTPPWWMALETPKADAQTSKQMTKQNKKPRQIWQKKLNRSKNALGAKIPKKPPGCELPKCCHMESDKKPKGEQHSKSENFPKLPEPVGFQKKPKIWRFSKTKTDKACKAVQDAELPKAPMVRAAKIMVSYLPKTPTLKKFLMSSSDAAPPGLVVKHSRNARHGKFQ